MEFIYTHCFFGSFLVWQQLRHDTLNFQFPFSGILVGLKYELRFGRVAGRPCRLLTSTSLQVIKAQNVFFFLKVFFRL